MGHASSWAIECLLGSKSTAGMYDASCGVTNNYWNGLDKDFVLYGAEVFLKYGNFCDDPCEKRFLTMDNVDCPHCLAWLDFAFEVKDL